MSSVDGERRGEFGKVSFRRKTAEEDKADNFIPSACIRRVHLTSLYSLMELPTTTDSNAPRAPLLLRFACHAPLFHSTLPPKHARSSRLLLRELRTTIWLESTAVANTETPRTLKLELFARAPACSSRFGLPSILRRPTLGTPIAALPAPGSPLRLAGDCIKTSAAAASAIMGPLRFVGAGECALQWAATTGQTTTVPLHSEWRGRCWPDDYGVDAFYERNTAGSRPILRCHSRPRASRFTRIPSRLATSGSQVEVGWSLNPRPCSFARPCGFDPQAAPEVYRDSGC